MTEPGREVIRIVIVDDHSVVRRGIRSLLSNHAEFAVVGEASTVDEALIVIDQFQPDVVLLDIRLPGESGLGLLAKIRSRPLKILILTSFEDEAHIHAALSGGAHGFILKNVSDEMLCGAIRTVYAGGHVMSSQISERVLPGADTAPDPAFGDEELRIIRLLIDGASNDQMAAELFMSVASVKRKLHQIFTKLKVQNRAQAAAVIVQRKLI